MHTNVELIGSLRKTAPDFKPKRSVKKMFHRTQEQVKTIVFSQSTLATDPCTPQRKHFSGRGPLDTKQQGGKVVHPLKNVSTLHQESLSRVTSKRIVKQNGRDLSLSLVDMVDRGTRNPQQKTVSPAKLNESVQSWRVLGLSQVFDVATTPQFEKKKFFAPGMGNPITGQGYIDHQKSGRRKFPTDSSSTSVNTSMLLDSRVKENRNPKKEFSQQTKYQRIQNLRGQEKPNQRLLARLQSSKF